MFTKLRLALSVAAALAAATPMLAQSGSRIIGLTRTVPTVQSQDIATCAVRRCMPANFPAPVAPCAGGTAYDTRTRGTWITNGTQIAKVDSRDQCNYQCSPQPLPVSTANAYATGLAYDHRGNRLFVTDSANGITVIRIQNCMLVPVSRCVAPTPPNTMLTGIAFDDVQNRVFWSAAVCGPNGIGGFVAVASAQNPCQPHCTVPIRATTAGTIMRPLQGVGYQACRDLVWVTDGITSVAGQIAATPIGCTWTQALTCTNPSLADPYVGLCIEPSTERNVGQPCASPGCAPCSPIHFMGNGDPVLGNTAFTIDGSNLPANTIAVTLLNLGPCNAAGLVIPPICGAIHVPLTGTIVAINQLTGGTIGCTGTTSVNASIHPDPALCGLVLSSQIVGICVTPGTTAVGTYVSNCMSWRVSSS